MTSPWRLKDADRPMRFFLTAFLLVLTAGYAIGLIFVDHTTSGTPSGIAEEIRGNQEPEGPDARGTGVDAPPAATELKFEKSPRELYTFLHNHVFSLSLLFFCVGLIFWFSSVRDGLKTFLLVEPFAAIVTTFGGIWLLRFVSPAFSWLVVVSGVSMLCCYALMLALILRELWLRR